MKILGISCYYHDSAAALVVDGHIVAAAQEERFSRVKGDERFPHQSIQFCLQRGSLTLDQVDIVVFYEKPLLKFERIVETYLNVAPRGLISFLTSMPQWLQKKLNQKKLLRNEFSKHFGSKPKDIRFSKHHLSHAASAFFPSPYDQAAVLCVDGVGEWATTTAWNGAGSELNPLWEIKFPHSLGLLYSTFTHYCGFKINSGEYKLMGLAPFGKPKYADKIKSELIQLNPDGSFKLNLKYFGFMDDLVATPKIFEDFFGRPARKPESEMTEFYKDIAASIQAVLNEAVIALAIKLKNDTGSNNLCLAGGVALNCVTNGLLAEQKIFENIWIQPAAGDAGSALGAALAFHYLAAKERRTVNKDDGMQAAYLGPEFKASEVKAILEKKSIKYQELAPPQLTAEVAKLLAQNKIVGWFQSRMEFGPRALGSRSILGNPLEKNMKSKMNLKIKFREGFRPFAPIVTEEAYKKYFSLTATNEYMLLVSKVLDPTLMPAITHVDNTARVQIVKAGKNSKLHELLSEFEKLTGHGVLINTSFNVRGEPIVCNPTDALICFINTDIDSLVMDNIIVNKEDNLQLQRSGKWHEQFKLD